MLPTYVDTKKKRKMYQPRMLPPGNATTACDLLMASANSVQKAVAAVILGILLINTLRCVVRSGEWRSEDRLFRSALSVCPLNAKVPCPPGSSSVHFTGRRKSSSRVKAFNVEQALLLTIIRQLLGGVLFFFFSVSLL